MTSRRELILSHYPVCVCLWVLLFVALAWAVLLKSTSRSAKHSSCCHLEAVRTEGASRSPSYKINVEMLSTQINVCVFVMFKCVCIAGVVVCLCSLQCGDICLTSTLWGLTSHSGTNFILGPLNLNLMDQYTLSVRVTFPFLLIYCIFLIFLHCGDICLISTLRGLT